MSSTASGEDKASLTRRILAEIYALYNDAHSVLGKHGVTHGLLSMAKAARMDDKGSGAILTPRRRVTVLIIGNHSAGKSSFVNYFCGEQVQATSVAVESKGMTIIRSGNETQEVQGEGALIENPHIAAVAARLGNDRENFIENLSLHVRSRRAPSGGDAAADDNNNNTRDDFDSVDLIDTPGLVDGGCTYPFEVNKAIVELAGVADLILVFLDPLGQALVARTMDVVRALNLKGYHGKMRYYLTKADSVSKQDDLIKVVAQVTRNLTQRLHDDHGFELPCLWIPEKDRWQLERYGRLLHSEQQQNQQAASSSAASGVSDDASSSSTAYGTSTPRGVAGGGAAATPHNPSASFSFNEGSGGGGGKSSSQQTPGGGGAAGGPGSLNAFQMGFFAPENNGLYKVLSQIRRCVDNKVQANMVACQKDCLKVMDGVDSELQEESRKQAIKRRWARYTWLLAPLFPLLALFSFLDILGAVHGSLPPAVTEARFVSALVETTTPVMTVLLALLQAAGLANLQQRLIAVGACFAVLSTFSQFFKCRSRGLRSRSFAELQQLRSFRVQAEVIRTYTHKLYQRYVRAVQKPEYDLPAPSAANGSGSSQPTSASSLAGAAFANLLALTGNGSGSGSAAPTPGGRLLQQ
jgi:uncharacterized membrane protein YgcG